MLVTTLFRPRYILAMLYIGTALLFETTDLQKSNIAYQFTTLGDRNTVAHTMSLYFIIIAIGSVSPLLHDRIPDFTRTVPGRIFLMTPLLFYDYFAVLAAVNNGTFLGLWWVSCIIALLLYILRNPDQ